MVPSVVLFRLNVLPSFLKISTVANMNLPYFNTLNNVYPITEDNVIKSLTDITSLLYSKIFINSKLNITGGQFSGLVMAWECWLVCGINYITNEVVLSLAYRSDNTVNVANAYIYRSSEHMSVNTNETGTVSLRYNGEVTNDIKGSIFRLI